MQTDPRLLAEEVRAALLRTALAAYEDAAIRGLCCEGAWEVAVAAMRDLDLPSAMAQAPESLQLENEGGMT